MVSADRYKSIDLTVIKLGRITNSSLKSRLDLNRFNSSNIIHSDNSRILRNFFKDLKIEHKTFIAKKKYSYNGTVHVQNVNNLINRLKTWIHSNFNSVSTKYLHNYLNWFLMLEILKSEKNAEDKMWDYILKTSEANNGFRNIEINYGALLK